MTCKTSHDHRAGALLTVVLLLLGTGLAAAGQVPDVKYGQAESFLHPEIDGMASTGTALFRGGFSAAINPALLSVAGGWRIDGAGALSQDHEDRFQPLYDSFNSYVTDTAIASNRHHFFDSGFAASRRLTGPFAFGAALTTAYAFDYEFSEELRDPNTQSDPRDRITEERLWRLSGSLRDLGAGISWQAGPHVAFGAAFHYVFGTIGDQHRRRFFLTPEDSYSDDASWDADGIRATYGVRIHPGERVELGFAVTTPMDVTGDVTTIASTASPDTITATVTGHKIRYPVRLRAGLAYFPRSNPRTVFAADVVYDEWSELTDDTAPGMRPLEDTMDVRVGVQHTFYNGVPITFGFRHADSYADNEAGTSMFTSSVGIPYQGGMFSVGTELSKVTSVQEHVFPYPSGYSTAPTARVESTRFRVSAGFRYQF